MKLKFYKLRAIALIYISNFFSKILFVEFPPILSVTAIIEKDNKLLFLELSYQNGLGFPGGIVQSDESLEQALKREVFEETGLTIVDSKYLWSVPSKYMNIGTISSVFLTKTTGMIKASNEGKLIWLEPIEAKDKLFYKDNSITIQKYLNYKNK